MLDGIIEMLLLNNLFAVTAQVASLQFKVFGYDSILS